MLSFEQLQPALFKWARIYSYQFKNRFEFWELINAVWIDGKAQNTKHIKLASIVVKRRMIDYIRDQTMYRRRQRADRQGKTFPYLNLFSSMFYDGSAEEEAKVERCMSTEDNTYIKTDRNDLFNYLLKGFSRQEKIIIKGRFIDDLQQTEIAKALGVTPSRVSQIESNLLLRMKSKLERYDNAKVNQDRETILL